MRNLKDIQNLGGVKVFLRADFNVPIKNGSVTEDFRIRMTLPTIDYLRERGAKLIIASHIESEESGNSLEPVARKLAELGVSARFVKDYKRASQAIESSDVILLENLRRFEGEKANDQRFAKELASLADIYVNDAFAVSHREHASVVSVPKYIDGYAGMQLEKEVTNLSKAFDPAHPFLFILAGKKFGTKIPLVNKFLSLADQIVIGGALSNDFFRAKGWNIGSSLASEEDIDMKPFLDQEKIILPTDIMTQNRVIKEASSLSNDDIHCDCGPETIDEMKRLIGQAKFILWNGPLGIYEQGFKDSTEIIAKEITAATKGGTISIVGGGDTVAAISALGIEDSFTFVSTGGGAMLDFLANGTLPGIEAIGALESI